MTSRGITSAVPRAARRALVAELERVLALEHDEAVGVLAVEVPARAALGARAHVGEDEVGRSTRTRTVASADVHERLAGARHGAQPTSRAQAVERALQALVELDLRLPAELFTRARGIERDVLDLAGPLGRVLGLEAVGRVLVQDLDDVEHRLLLPEADVDRARRRPTRRREVGVDHVVDVDVVARLLAVAEDGRLPPSSSLPQKIAITPASPSGSWRGP